MGLCTSQCSRCRFESGQYDNEPDIRDPIDPRLKERFAELAPPPRTMVEKAVLAKILACPGAPDLGSRLLKNSPDMITLENFMHTVRRAVGDWQDTVEGETRSSFFFRLFSGKSNVISFAATKEIIREACALAVASERGCDAAFPTLDTPIVVAAAASLQSTLANPEEVSCAEFCDWVAYKCPNLFTGYMKWVEIQCLSHPTADLEEDFMFAVLHAIPKQILNGVDSSKLVVDDLLQWGLACCLPDTFRKPTHWTLLFSSKEHGHSFAVFRRLVHAYEDATVLVLKLSSGEIVGVCVDESWQNDSVFGQINTYLFTAVPELVVRDKAVKVAENTHLRRVEDRGIGVGANPSAKDVAELWISSDFETATVEFEPLGKRASPLVSKIVAVEVWGCGNPATKEQANQNRSDAAAAYKSKANRALLLDDKMIVELASKPKPEPEIR